MPEKPYKYISGPFCMKAHIAKVADFAYLHYFFSVLK